MTRAILTAAIIILLQVAVGCNNVDTGKAQLVTPASRAAVKAVVPHIVGAAETDLVEQLVVNRRAYQASLESLIKYYNSTGNDMKLRWAGKELESLEAMPRYDYIIEAALAGADLKAGSYVPEADELYQQARNLEKQAGSLPLIKDEDTLRLALDKYNTIIKNHPTSNKIDAAAYRAGYIYEHFKDYSIAALYYKRAFQWNPKTHYPARFKAAYILDQRLHRRAEALELYQQAVEKHLASQAQLEFAKTRIKLLTKSDRQQEIE